MSATQVPIYMVEAFTSGNNDPYTGNTAAVCILQYDDDISDDIKQKIATTMNVSETAFVALDWTKNPETLQLQNTNNKNGTIKRTLRWFTPLKEVPLCGHATVAATKALLTHLNETENDPSGAKVTRIEFQSKYKGVLPVEYENGFISINFPVGPMKEIPLTSESKGYFLSGFIRNALGPLFPFEGDNVSKVVEEIQLVDDGAFLIVQLKPVANELPETTVKKAQPNFEKLLETHEELGANASDLCVTVTIQGEGEQGPHFYSRIFAPAVGINEDPVTGSAHAALTPFWINRLGFKRDAVLRARQASERGGDLRCQLVQGDENRSVVSGRARVVYSATLNL